MAEGFRVTDRRRLFTNPEKTKKDCQNPDCKFTVRAVSHHAAVEGMLFHHRYAHEDRAIQVLGD